MTIEIKVPPLPESVADATLINWHKKTGDQVSRDENLVDLETDKVVLEVPSPKSGILTEIKIKDGSVVKAGDILAVMTESSLVSASKDNNHASDASSSKNNSASDTSKNDSKDKKVSPSVKVLLKEHDLDASMIDGSGKDGRITKTDVLDYLRDDEGGSVRSNDIDMPLQQASVAAKELVSNDGQRVPMTRLRAKIAERMVEAQTNSAMLTSFNEIDLFEVMELRKKYKESFLEEHSVKLGFMSFFSKASVEALKKFPIINASIDGQDIVYHDRYDIGIAVSSERGLMVPVIKNLDELSFAEIERSIAELAIKAKNGSITMEDLTGGTFTITNGGTFGSLISTPILNSPQSAILGMHGIKERPVVVDGKIVIRPMMYVALTYDHRIIDGREAVLFLVSIKESLEDPERLMLEI
ncbi:MAG: 2-oxoglutarate dehydrogenase E2 component (dihydrolipoamide succinyltransferase) [Woeseiaceae bacterium]|jgi:2-oxoglutarate dehydrogenase E2 component (dihydrolipoamide succinyltransferase)|tara:strand:+ start:10949 stop:12187 length:1239 start_codon:yes stop_codon:yes gene_type:complete